MQLCIAMITTEQAFLRNNQKTFPIPFHGFMSKVIHPIKWHVWKNSISW